MQNLDHALSAELNQRKLDHLYRKRNSHDGPQTPQLKINGQTLLAFCSNDYLGLANHPALISAAQNACVDYGLGSGASHLVAGHTEVHHELEEALARLTQRPRALLFSSGYMANMGVLSSLLDRQDAVYQDRLNHASLLDGGLLSAAKFQRYRHQDLSDLQRQLDKTQARRHLVATDAVFSMDGDTALLKPLSQLCCAQQAWLMIDDAHGFGVLGPDGGGSALAQGLTTDDCPIYMATLGKALGSYGAFVAGSDVLIETLIQFSRNYIYTTALPPAIAAASLAAVKLLQHEVWRQQHLNHLIRLFKQQAEHLRLPLMPSGTAIQPLLIGSSEMALRLSESLKEMGFLVTAIRPPTVPKNTARLRITLSAAHTENHLQQLLAALLKLQHQGLLAVVDD
ncbi:MAG: 8-amino-7-oxononanoate synthase [Oceanospirillaceae bacterium]|jgi:8-amino-7-oxononanoate synthase|nr:8-amino-7-oxononanoate synthase [Oceanospirillaceae bacterium]MBT4997784.1 8-amino-7-oxononanoate synthase [Oceanospirillaceae bacterium]MBT5629649.1 8-amino-7-oxononanoate synthase [Oceanospirillaceae bacterium]MBT6101105.1 8-amino-7-oxononanoate synthase [Oceanospirillaceae bacterium]MBT7673520.1 8-amino-7-oxononanoate synthase [Oceanospirillaceae bacterium]